LTASPVEKVGFLIFEELEGKPGKRPSKQGKAIITNVIELLRAGRASTPTRDHGMRADNAKQRKMYQINVIWLLQLC
jgi:hypothetical protein